jgi:AraC family transcriptional regulator, regulatory protein of adaptative response / methylated-DNA-[protein]-cysteine methyltransferase
MVTTLERQSETNSLIEEARWRAVLERDASIDGEFVYAVRSTGIYCRPSCPSRRPQREQVLFFPVPEVAEGAGYRSCRRCLPHRHPSPEPRLEMVRRACQYMRESSDRFPTLAQVSAAVGASPYHLQRVFKQVMGITPRKYADACRLEKLKANLKNGQNVTDSLYDAGYSSSSRLYEPASIQLGMTPGAYRNGGPGLQIAYTVVDSPLGLLLVAATERGVCAISLGDDEAQLEDALRREYPASEIRREDTALHEWVQPIVQHLSGQLPHVDISLDIRATAFERLVWEELRRIPYGETRSYSQIARAIGQPRAARAVARACSQNPVAVLVPCHRVVRQDGSIGGYKWGVARKEHLLAQEKDEAQTEGSPGP